MKNYTASILQTILRLNWETREKARIYALIILHDFNAIEAVEDDDMNLFDIIKSMTNVQRAYYNYYLRRY